MRALPQTRHRRTTQGTQRIPPAVRARTMLLVSLFVYATALARLVAAGLESNILVPLSAGFLFGPSDWKQRSRNPYRNHFQPFTYMNDLKILYRRVGDDDCRICYGSAEDCYVMSQSRCDYYVNTAEIMDSDESGETLSTAPELKLEVDSMLYNLIDRASGDPRYTDCIPLLSRYTDCTKDNICLGCKTCECDVEGRWNCTQKARCRPESDIHEIDRRVLRSVIENLKKPLSDLDRQKEASGIARRKRSESITQETVTLPIEKVFNEVQESKTEASDLDIKTLLFNSNNSNKKEATEIKRLTKKPKLSDKEISEWLQDMHLDGRENKSETTDVTLMKTKDTFDYKLTTPNLYSTINESDYLAFDEVLHNISVDSKNSSREKSIADISSVDRIVDYMSDNEDTIIDTEKYIDDANIFYDTVTQSPFTKLDEAAVTKAIEKSITEIVIDLLESAKINDNLNDMNDRNFALLDYMDISDKLNTTFPKSHPENVGIVEINNVNIMKRDIHNVTISTKFPDVMSTTITTDKTTVNVTGTTVTTTSQTKETENIDDVNKNVVNPLTDILNQKEKEIEELTKIRTNLILFLDNYRNRNLKLSFVKNESFLNNYKQRLITRKLLKGDVKISNMTLKDKYSLKLKRDIYEVIKDIVGIQKLIQDPKKLPDDLKFLIRAMKHYVHKQGFHIKNKIKKDNYRRRWNTDRSFSYDPIREKVIQILEVIDKDMPLTTGLYPLSKTAKKLLKRIIKQNYIDEFAMIGLRVYDPNYNLTNDLRNIGTKWKKMMDSISASPPSDELYTTKLLHLELSVDISKMNDALSLIKFAQRRSMVPVDEVIGEEIISQISESLDNINKKILTVVHHGAKSINRKTKYWASGQTTTTAPKISFIQQIKSLLHNSKRDIIDLLRKKVPKTDVLKELARKQLDINKNKLSEYERTMSSWQHNFGALPNNARKRRGSDFTDRRDRSRIKNIIPRYLRGKVRPAINNKNNKKSKSRKSNNNTGHKASASTSSTSTSIINSPSSIIILKTVVPLPRISMKSEQTSKPSKP